MLAVVIVSAAAAAAVAARCVLRDSGSAGGRQPGPETAGLVAVITAEATGAGITAGLWLDGQLRTAGWALILAAVLVAVAGAGYAAGLRSRRAPALPHRPPVSGPGRQTWEEDTLDWDRDLAVILRDLDRCPPPGPRVPPQRRPFFQPRKDDPGTG